MRGIMFNRSIEAGAWRAFRSEIYATYDFKEVAKTARERAVKNVGLILRKYARRSGMGIKDPYRWATVREDVQVPLLMDKENYHPAAEARGSDAPRVVSGVA
jgi:hypothetical protein